MIKSDMSDGLFNQALKDMDYSRVHVPRITLYKESPAKVVLQTAFESAADIWGRRGDKSGADLELVKGEVKTKFDQIGVHSRTRDAIIAECFWK